MGSCGSRGFQCDKRTTPFVNNPLSALRPPAPMDYLNYFQVVNKVMGNKLAVHRTTEWSARRGVGWNLKASFASRTYFEYMMCLHAAVFPSCPLAGHPSSSLFLTLFALLSPSRSALFRKTSAQHRAWRGGQFQDLRNLRETDLIRIGRVGADGVGVRLPILLVNLQLSVP